MNDLKIDQRLGFESLFSGVWPQQELVSSKHWLPLAVPCILALKCRSAEKEDLRLQTRRAVVRLRWLQPIRGRARPEFRPSFRQLGVGSYDVT